MLPYTGRQPLDGERGLIVPTAIPNDFAPASRRDGGGRGRRLRRPPDRVRRLLGLGAEELRQGDEVARRPRLGRGGEVLRLHQEPVPVLEVRGAGGASVGGRRVR